MNRSNEEDFLREILAEDDDRLAEFRRASLALGLESVRRKRRRSRALQIGLAAALPVMLAAAFGMGWVRHRPWPPVQAVSEPVRPPPLPAPTEAVARALPAARGIKIISDKELFALFPDRPLALIGKPGQQRLVFLDAGTTASGDSPTKTPGARLTE